MFKITVDSNVSEASEKVKKEIIRRRAELLQVLGVQLLSNVLLAYNDKSRGRTGEDGIKWKPLAESTIKKKNKRGKGRRGRRGGRKGIEGPSGNTSTFIGVDSGLQRNSASPGFRAPDSKGGNIFDINEQAAEVTVGFGRSYSEYFDEDRPLLPNDLPEDWEVELEDITEKHYEEIFEEFEK